jgi:hypothetical protein
MIMPIPMSSIARTATAIVQWSIREGVVADNGFAGRERIGLNDVHCRSGFRMFCESLIEVPCRCCSALPKNSERRILSQLRPLIREDGG